MLPDGMVAPIASDASSSAVKTAYAEYRAYVRKALVGCGVPSADVEDLTHEVFVVLLRRIDEQRNPAALRSWLFQTARRVASNHRRSARRARDRIARIPRPEPEVGPDDRVARAEAAAFVARFLDGLEPDARRLFLLSEIEGRRGIDVAAELSLEPKTTYARVHALRRRFDRAAARELGRPTTRAWLLVAGLGGAMARVLRRGWLLKSGVAAAALLLAAAAWWALRSAPPGEGPRSPDAGPVATWNPADETDLRRELESRALEVRSVRASLAGRVHDEQSRGVVGAYVCAWPHAVDFAFSEIGKPTCTTTGEDGRYRLENVVPGRLRLSAAARGYLPGEARPGAATALEVQPGERDGLDILLESGGMLVAGQVEDMMGGPVEGVTIVLRQQPSGGGGADPLTFGAWGDKTPLVLESGEDGRFEGSVAPGELHWQTHGEGYASTRGSTTAPAVGLVIRVAPEAVLAGIVVDAQSGEPQPGVRVVAWADPGSLSHASGGADTDADGRFRIGALPPGRYKPWASSPGRLGIAERSAALGPGQSVDDLRIPMEAAPIVRATVRIAESGEPCPKGLVGLIEDGRGRTEWQVIGPDGQVVFPAVLPGKYRPRVGCDGYRPGLLYPVVDAGQRSGTDLTWEVFEGVALTGVVTMSNGRPASGALVTVAPLEGPIPLSRGVRADEAGRFSLPGLDQHRVAVTAAAAGEVTSEAIEVALGSKGAEIALALEAGGSIVGIVTDGEGEPISDAIVVVADPERGQGDARRTDDEGRFAVEGLVLRAYDVRASLDGGWRPQRQRVELAAGSPHAELAISIETGTGNIAGRVVDTSGAAIPDALVAIEDNRPGIPVREHSVLSQSDGAFVLSGLPHGSHDVVAVAPDGSVGRASKVEAGEQTPIEIVIDVAASVAGRITVEQGELPSVFEISASGSGRRITEAFASRDGSWALEGLTPGKVSLSAVTGLGRVSADVTLSPGERRDGIELKLVGRVDLEGQIVDLETGEPLAGFAVVATAVEDGYGELGKAAEIASVMGPADPRQLTKADGRFVVPSVSVGVVNIAAHPEGFPESSHDSIVAAVPVPLEEPLRLASRKMVLPYGERPGELGLQLARNDYDEPLIIESITPDGPAAGLDIRPNDTIVAIDGRDATGVDKYLGRYLMRSPPGRTVRLTLGRGPTIEFTPQ
jgi:RNA polymerase sigma factor (sigma-70 family)